MYRWAGRCIDGWMNEWLNWGLNEEDGLDRRMHESVAGRWGIIVEETSVLWLSPSTITSYKYESYQGNIFVTKESTCSIAKRFSFPSCSQDLDTFQVNAPAISTFLTLDVVIATVWFTLGNKATARWLINKAIGTPLFSLTGGQSS